MFESMTFEFQGFHLIYIDPIKSANRVRNPFSKKENKNIADYFQKAIESIKTLTTSDCNDFITKYTIYNCTAKDIQDKVRNMIKSSDTAQFKSPGFQHCLGYDIIKSLFTYRSNVYLTTCLAKCN